MLCVSHLYCLSLPLFTNFPVRCQNSRRIPSFVTLLLLLYGNTRLECREPRSPTWISNERRKHGGKRPGSRRKAEKVPWRHTEAVVVRTSSPKMTRIHTASQDQQQPRTRDLSQQQNCLIAITPVAYPPLQLRARLECRSLRPKQREYRQLWDLVPGTKGYCLQQRDIRQ